MAFGVVYQLRNVRLSPFHKVLITSPGYPHRDYERNTNYTWDVRADDATEEIFINLR